MSDFATAPLDELVDDLAGYEEKDLRDLIERAYQLEELTRHPGWPLLVDLVTAATVTRQKIILSGACKSLEDYAQQTGWIKGAQAALVAPHRMQQRLDNARERLESEREDNSPTERE